MRLLKTLAWLALSALAASGAGNGIRLKTRTIEPPRVVRPFPRSHHAILRFESAPDGRLLAELAHRRIRVLAFLPETALMVAFEGQRDLSGLNVTWAGPLEPADKISPALAADPTGVYLVMFHPDVDSEPARGVIEDRGLRVLENPGLLPGHFLVTGNRDRVLELASYDEVAYLLPGRTELALRRKAYGCPGPVTPSGVIAEYALAGSAWPKDASGAVALRYFIESLTGRLDPNAARSEIERALAEWAHYANLSFAPALQASAPRSVDILFAAGAHGDPYPFASSNVLAHTFYPAPPNPDPVAGDIHFNANEDWRVGSGIDLFTVALHEAGHALGLGHSDNPDSAMYPYYRQAAGLTNDDIAAIQALYGSPSAKAPASPAAPPVTPVTPPVANPVPPASPGSGQDTTPPSIVIVSPALSIVSTAAASIAIAGTAADNIGVTSVKWSVSTGSAGTAAGTGNWSASVPLLVGTNVVTVRAYDAAGNFGWRSVTVIRQ